MKIIYWRIFILIGFILFHIESASAQCENHACDPLLTGMKWNTDCVEEMEFASLALGWAMGGGDPTCKTPSVSWRIQVSFAQAGQYIVESASSASGTNFSYTYDEPNKTVNCMVNQPLNWLDSGEIIIEVKGVTTTDCNLLLSGANIQIMPSFLGGCPQAFANQIANDALSAGLGVEEPISLPVELIEFKGKYNERTDANDLSWSTASEVNSDFFSVEKMNAENVFEKIGEVKSNGNSNIEVSYDFVDREIRENKIYYYRLRQVDLDGKEEILPTIAIKVDRPSSGDIEIFPNPTRAEITILYSNSANSERNLTVDIFDITGRKMKSYLMTNENYLDLIDFRSGIYMIQISDESKQIIHREKLIKI